MVLTSTRIAVLLISLAHSVWAQTPVASHNVILFVADGLRAASVTPESAPVMARLRSKGVDFANSHSLYPTVTTANASAIATGHYLGDTGDFGNTLYFGFPVWAHGGAPVTFLENDAVLGELNQHFQGNYLNQESLVAAARKAGLATAVIGKVGPSLIQDVAGKRDGTETIIVDDSFGKDGGLPVIPAILAALRTNGLPAQTPDISVPDLEQEAYLGQVAARVVLPCLAGSGKPFLMVFWSRDPDYSQHNARDSFGQLEPGINGSTSRAAVRKADDTLAALLDAVRELHLEDTTDVFVTADHGFGTIVKGTITSGSSVAARCANPDRPAIGLPQGFLAVDLAKGLGLPLFDPDAALRPLDCATGDVLTLGNGLIGPDPAKPQVVVTANGGSDVIYLPQGGAKPLAADIVRMLSEEDYVSGIFVNDSLGEIPGALPMSRINLIGAAVTPVPAIVVNFGSFRSFSGACADPLLCTGIIADSNLREGQGNHGGFSRAEIRNFMAAAGPDFKTGYVDDAPVSNADVPVTLARILGLSLAGKAVLTGRSLGESLQGESPSNGSARRSDPRLAANGMATILNVQRVGATAYFYAAGFPGRTVGLELPPAPQ